MYVTIIDDKTYDFVLKYSLRASSNASFHFSNSCISFCLYSGGYLSVSSSAVIAIKPIVVYTINTYM